ncbi:somatomedin-B and thrombospondin type-1 domain-containing protein isoform X3 [Hippocampus zosterae]|uniref:somatomedin-B and thrombospondin type-1 domain-containing protein isoform X3 n=1 Tax=Hippocampus zosterae TaxID=109293 RepID=UPI00223E87F8|nr:somatomedin-B and thrombospondin type-1 domain-containing protein isoform X3 [Hippocampus zosterae]
MLNTSHVLGSVPHETPPGLIRFRCCRSPLHQHLSGNRSSCSPALVSQLAAITATLFDTGAQKHLRAAIDCAVGSWGPWSSCTSPCGVGSTERSRQVSVPPRNGGMPCPDLKQRRGCFGNNEICSSAKEVAKILPDSFKRNFKDPWRRPHMLLKEEKASYCVYMRLKQASAACKLKLWSAQLVRERLVCAECQSDAMSKSDRCGGDGLEGTRTFWSAASAVGCHGSWVRESSSKGCRCPSYSVLFV